MRVRHRRRHGIAFATLVVVLPLVYLGAVRARQSSSPPTATTSLGEERVPPAGTPLYSDSIPTSVGAIHITTYRESGTGSVRARVEVPPGLPWSDPLLYWAPDVPTGLELPAGSILVGPLHARRASLVLPDRLDGGAWALVDLARQELLGVGTHSGPVDPQPGGGS